MNGSLWWVMLLGGLLTYGIRLSFIWLLGRVDIPEWLRRALRFVPPAVLTAIIVPEVLIRDGALEFSLGNERLIAALAAILVAWRTKNALWTIAAGMAILWIIISVL